MVQASSISSVLVLPIPFKPDTGLPAEAVKPFELIEMMLYEATVGVFASVPSVTPLATSLQTVAI